MWVIHSRYACKHVTVVCFHLISRALILFLVPACLTVFELEQYKTYKNICVPCKDMAVQSDQSLRSAL